MSVLQSQQEMKISSANHLIFNNADLTPSIRSWGSLKFSNFANPDEESLDSASEKENQGPQLENRVSSISNEPFKPVNRDCLLMEKSRIEPVSKKGFLEKEEETATDSIRSNQNDIRDEKKIDEEINAIECKISRLNSRLETLKLEKYEMRMKSLGNRAVKFMEKNESIAKKIEEINSSLSARTKAQRRALSLGPAEIVAGGRRRTSIVPSEFFNSKKQEMISPVQNRRKSCFWKLQDIDKEKVVCKEREKSLIISLKSRKVATNTQIPSRQAATTVSSRKVVKKEDVLLNSAAVTNTKSLKPGRVVASRYNQNTSSFPGNVKDNSKICDKKRSLSFGKQYTNGKSLGTESRKQWEIPSEIVVHGSVEGEKSPQCIVVVPELLPRIRIARLTNESPRDSGAAKRVAELVGRKSFFADDEEEIDASLCQALKYADEDIEKEES